MTSIVFPGQGSQKAGMIRDFYENFSVAKHTLEEIEDSVSLGLKKIIFENEDDLLNVTKYTQICIFASSLVIFKTLFKEANLNLSSISTMLGHSLGEYSALAACEKLNIKDCSKILVKRGELMNDAVEEYTTGMAALIGFDSDKVEKLILEKKLDVQVANDNSPIQVVISGNKLDLEKSKIVFQQEGLKKFIKLNVSSAFHSKFMIKAEEILKSEIDNLVFESNDINIISNFSATQSASNQQIIDSLKNQMSNKVRWKESVYELEKTGEKKIIEIGPGKVLSGLIKRISNQFNITSIDSINDISEFQ